MKAPKPSCSSPLERTTKFTSRGETGLTGCTGSKNPSILDSTTKLIRAHSCSFVVNNHSHDEARDTQARRNDEQGATKIEAGERTKRDQGSSRVIRRSVPSVKF